MDDFSEMRRLAREKRDAAIKQARLEYSATLEQINELQKRLCKKPSQKGRPKPLVPMRMMIMDAAPVDRTFTVSDVLRWLERPETDKGLIQSTLCKMIKRGDIRRLRRGRSNVQAIYAVSDYGPSDLGLNSLSQIEAARLVMADLGKPVDATTLVVEMLERGYKPVVNEKALRKSLQRVVSEIGFPS